MQRAALIGAASGWGAGFRGTQDGPLELRELGLAGRLATAGIPARWAAMVEAELDHRVPVAPSAKEKFGIVARHNARLANAVAAAMAARELPVVLGGDHAIAIGTWGGVARGLQRAPFGLIWLDAHLDAHTAETTPSMNAHGMSAAVLLGHGLAEFLAVGGGVLRPENLCYVGIRSYELGEWALLRRLGVRIFHMDEIAKRGLAAVMCDALAIARRGTAGFGLTIDLDGFDPEDVPGVGLPVPDGLRAAEACRVLRRLGRHPDLRAIEIVEYNPALDHAGKTARLVQDLLTSLLLPAAATLRASSAA